MPHETTILDQAVAALNRISGLNVRIQVQFTFDADTESNRITDLVDGFRRGFLSGSGPRQ